VFAVVTATASAALTNDVVILDGGVIDLEAGLDAIRNIATAARLDRGER
jgi:hypothetical protein